MSQQPTFDFMAQCHTAQSLLDACVKALPLIPDGQENENLVQALREFEVFGVATMWSAGDMDDESDLTEDEKRQAINDFIEHYECTDADWRAIEDCGNAVVAQRPAEQSQAEEEVPA